MPKGIKSYAKMNQEEKNAWWKKVNKAMREEAERTENYLNDIADRMDKYKNYTDLIKSYRFKN
jgi:uncharacterized protein YllA (UPF0747 family)